ncbi:GntR family transcriptional regulator [Pusillimonas sp. ANT_WB101]|uniref:GntR family transcriptional regulator n=1 Tax=Pusillimonas sp. ANT_WB101 TaxID=2597356 RepID=UPI0011ED4E8C|nr:GntR family transcriptional regulator [Pusillimonas sp. ANT_WB101]KAA0910546.1 GntR family transcriptional regulator [Pusillimonas sp. ANT_WB101]
MTVALKPPPRRETLGSNALAQIKELLLTGRVMPGEQLSLRSMAEALGVSVMPVREAVYQLVADQALEVAPNRSVRVPTLSAEQFSEISEIRLQVEGYAVKQATQHVTPDLLSELRRLNKALADEMGPPGKDMANVVQLNKNLHFAIYEAAGMPMLVKIIESLWLRIGPILNYDLHIGSERTENKIAVAHHEKMIDALEAGDARSARDALQSDIRSAFEHIYQKQFS